MEAVAYRIFRTSDSETLFEGIVRNTEDNIYPAQEEPYLLNEFPDLPFECELHHFKVKGLSVLVVPFEIEFDEIIRHHRKNKRF